jgi:hypothetical protein
VTRYKIELEAYGTTRSHWEISEWVQWLIMTAKKQDITSPFIKVLKIEELPEEKT